MPPKKSTEAKTTKKSMDNKSKDDKSKNDKSKDNKPKNEKPKNEKPKEDKSKDEEINQEPSTKKTTIPKFKFDGDLEEVETQYKEMKEHLTQLQKDFQRELTIQKHYTEDLYLYAMRLRKESDKLKAKKESRKSIERIAPQFPISDELAEFMGKEPGSKAARTETLSFISKYAKENKLSGVEVKDADGNVKINNMLIRLDDKLEKLFPELAKSDEYLQYNSILKHIKPHFPNK